MVCEICGSPEDLTTHHIVPRKVRVDNRPKNLARLCEDCHALVERFYWKAMAQKNPWVARAYKLICQLIRTHENPRIRELLRQQQAEALQLLLVRAPDWRYTYLSACSWVRSVTPVRKVQPRDAILSDPWWVRSAK